MGASELNYIFIKEKTMKKLLGLSLAMVFMVGCAPEIGSEEWCTELKEKPKGDWTANEAKDFTKHCIF